MFVQWSVVGCGRGGGGGVVVCVAVEVREGVAASESRFFYPLLSKNASQGRSFGKFLVSYTYTF